MINTSASMIQQGVLQSGEQVLWLGRPGLKYVRPPIHLYEVVASFILGTFIGYIFMILVMGSIKTTHPSQKTFAFFASFFAVQSGPWLLTWYKTYFLTRGKMPPYWRYTQYAITNLRVLIIVTLPSTRPIVVAYTPEDIGELTDVVRADGSGTLTFGEPRSS